MQLTDLLKTMTQQRASDLFLKVGNRPSLRIDGKIRFLNLDPITVAFNEEVLSEVSNDQTRRKFLEDGEADAAYEPVGIGRFRVNIFRQRANIGFVFRHIQSDIPSFGELNLPVDVLQKLAAKPRGLVLITGVAGSGKSTALASIVEYINSTQKKHIVTIEDPIEFTYEDKRSIINQREIGLDTKDFCAALKHCVRQSPDVILIGEMRDKETMEAAVNAAETGHLVLSTLHTVNAVQTVERIIAFFPPHQHDLIRLQLSMVLEGAISLRLIPRKDGEGRVPAVEIMLATPRIKDLLQSGRTREIREAIRTSGHYGACTFNQSLVMLKDAGVISQDRALSAADNPEELKLEFQGIGKGTKVRELALKPESKGEVAADAQDAQGWDFSNSGD